MGGIQLRDYQQRGIDTIERMILNGRRSVLAVAPTGAGKGTMAAQMLVLTAKAGGQAVFVVHRREILYDMRERLRAQGIEAGVIMGDVKPERDLPVQLASVQSLLHVRHKVKTDLLIVDEAHHYAADEWKSVVKHVKPYATVGFTATPERQDGRPLGNMFEYLIDVVSYSELLARGDIVPCKVLRPECPLGTDLADDAASAYLEYTPGTKAFIFVRSLKHAGETLAALAKGGVRARVVDTNTPDKVRADVMAKMHAGDIDVIVNYYTMTEGIDIPEVSTVVLARNVQHEGAYMQMVGRALRAYPGKTQATVLDLAGASFTHGLPLDNRVYSLKARMRRDGKDMREHRAARREVEAVPDVLHLKLIEATEESQRKWGRRRIDWGKVGLGEKRDAEIAEQTGVSIQTVRKIRQQKEIAHPERVVQYATDWDQVDFVNKSDAQLAREIGVDVSTVRIHRRKRGIKRAFRSRGVRVEIDWDREPLGREPDKAIARKHGISPATVLAARKQRNIPPFAMGIHPEIDWDSQPLGKISDADLAARLNVTKRAVARQRDSRGITPFVFGRVLSDLDRWENVPFDTKSDWTIAQEMGLSPSFVRFKRRQFERQGKINVAPHRLRARNTYAGKTIDWDAQPLGLVPDRELAKRLGVTDRVVRTARLYRNIPSAQGPGRPRKSSESPTADR